MAAKVVLRCLRFNSRYTRNVTCARRVRRYTLGNAPGKVARRGLGTHGGCKDRRAVAHAGADGEESESPPLRASPPSATFISPIPPNLVPHRSLPRPAATARVFYRSRFYQLGQYCSPTRPPCFPTIPEREIDLLRSSEKYIRGLISIMCEHISLIER